MKKIVLIVESFGAGVFGVVNFVANRFAASGHDVYVLHDIRPDTPSNYPALFDSRVRLVHFPIRRMSKIFFSFGDLRRFASFLKSVDPDVIHLHSSFAGALGRLVKPFLRINSRWYYSPHAFKFASGGRSSLIFWMFEWILSFSNVPLIACSRGEMNQAKYFWSSSMLLENAASVLHDVEVDNCKDDFLIVSMGRMVSQKRPEMFLDICARSKIDSSKFLWIGSGDDAYEEMFRERGVRFTGWIESGEARRILSGCTIYLQCSSYEGMPLSVIEAQLYGKPCLVTDVVGNRDVVVDGVTGFVCNDADDFLQKIEYLRKNHDALSKMASAAKKMAATRFDPDLYYQRISNIYGITCDV